MGFEKIIFAREDETISHLYWASYGTAKKGSLKLVPPPHVLKELQKDYGLMRSMFFREVPSWELILKTIEQFEKEFNCVTG